MENDLDIESCVKAWDRCDIRTVQLAKLQHHLKITVETLQALGSRGPLMLGLITMLDSVKNIKESRSRI